jgi:hypothetical protein
MGRELGRISGPLLAENLLRNGQNLAFDTKVLYLDVVNKRIGFNNSTPVTDLYTPTNIGTTNLIVDNLSDNANISNFVIGSNHIQNSISSITIRPNQASNPTITAPGISTSALLFRGNTLSNTASTNLKLSPIGTGVTNIRSNVTVNGDLHATGNITFDGNITFGDSPTDTVTFGADVKSDIIPKTTNTDNLGSSSNTWKTIYIKNEFANTLITTDITVNSNFNLTGTNNFQGNITFGDFSTETLNVLARFSSNLVSNNRSIGSFSKFWKNLYTNTFTTGNIQASNNALTTTQTNTNLQLIANGTGKVKFKNLYSTNIVTINGNLTTHNATSLATTNLSTVLQTGNILQTGNFTQTGASSFNTSRNFKTNNLTLTGLSSYLSVGNFKISGNTLLGTATDSDIIFNANGTGSTIIQRIAIQNNVISSINNSNILLTPKTTASKVVINTNKSLILPLGNDINRVLTTTGELRFNNVNNNFEGKSSLGNVNLQGLASQNYATYITPELTLGAGDNTLRFVSNNILVATITPTGLIASTLVSENISISGATINNINPINPVNLVGNGNGIVNINSTIISENNINSASLSLSNTGTGYTKFGGATGVVFPKGNNSQRPNTPEEGTVRFNTDINGYEVYDTVLGWIPWSGVQISQDVVADEANLWSIILG